MQTKVFSSELKIGMFVSSLDRPWIDTPFMFQGFLIETDDDISQLQKYCEFVHVDWERSPMQQTYPSTNRQGLSVTKATDNKSYLSSASQTSSTIEKSQLRSKKYAIPAVSNKRPAFIPKHIELSVYVDASPVEEEIAPAVKAHTHANDVLKNLVQDIQSNKRFAIEETGILIEEVVSSMVRNPDAMMWVTRLRKQDEVVYGHGLQVAVYLVALGRHLGLPKLFLDQLCTIGLLLDIGKVKLPKELLLKKGRLSTEEFETIKSHVQLAIDILKETPDLHPDVLQGIAQHHERENGSGYPAGLSGNEIGLFGRMSAIVDSFSALTTPRTYAEAMPAYEALRDLSNFNPGLYQATMIEQFIQAIGAFPVGSMVELSSGEVAVVISHSKVRRLKPRVLIIADSNKLPSPQPATLDLLYQPLIVNQEERYIQRGLPTGAFGLDAREFYIS
ncbi:MAG: HD domain-containing phosphohydrolase [Gallionella sp.]